MTAPQTHKEYLMQNRLMTTLTAISLTLASLPAAAQTLTERSDYWRHGWDWGWGHMAFGGLMMVLFWGGIILLVVFAARWLGAGPADRTPSPPKKSALDILGERFAQGDIDKVEYEERKRILSS